MNYVLIGFSQYYPVQITARNGTVQFDYPAWDTVSNYGWDGHVIMGQSNRCADLRQQSWDMRNGWPNIFDVIHDYDKSMAWLNSLDVNNIDFIDCLWSIPILEYSDGPHFTGMDKALDTSSEIGYIISESPLSLKSDRTMWKDDRPKSEQVWEVVDISDYCPRMKAEWNIVTGYFELVENIIRNTLGWGEVTSDDQVVADVFGAQQLVAPGSDAETALGKIQTAACEKQHKDSMAIITKEVVDILINVAAFAATGGMGFFAGLLVGVNSTLGPCTVYELSTDNIIQCSPSTQLYLKPLPIPLGYSPMSTIPSSTSSNWMTTPKLMCPQNSPQSIRPTKWETVHEQ